MLIKQQFMICHSCFVAYQEKPVIRATGNLSAGQPSCKDTNGAQGNFRCSIVNVSLIVQGTFLLESALSVMHPNSQLRFVEILSVSFALNSSFFIPKLIKSKGNYLVLVP